VKQTKKCSKCKKRKDLEDFAKDGERRRADCKICNSKRSLAYYENHKQESIRRIIKWKNENRDKLAIYRKGHYQRNKIKIKQYNQRPDVRIKINLRNRLGHICRGRKCDTTEKLVGCSWIDLRNHIQSLWTANMTWDNYGEWHIDHKRPCASFDLTIPAQQRECFHFTNLQPLWAKDNLTKGDSIIQSLIAHDCLVVHR